MPCVVILIPKHSFCNTVCLYGHVNKARSCCKVGSAVTDKVKTFTATGLGLIVISIVIGFGTIVIAKIKHANFVTKLSQDEVFKMPVVLKLCKFVTF